MIYDTYDTKLERAEHACQLLDGYERQWFVRLLDLLRTGHCVRVKLRYYGVVDVVAIANTYSYCSFFDIYNTRHYRGGVDYACFPYPVKVEENSLSSLEQKISGLF